MSPGSEFEEFARDCVRLANQAPSPELREKLFDIAREWMRAAMDEQEPRRTTPGSRGSSWPHATSRIESDPAPHKMNPAEEARGGSGSAGH
jgi:hypothetical protein